jgi:hypothetical protein
MASFMIAIREVSGSQPVQTPTIMFSADSPE